jgi:hypothetical protein
VIVPVCGIQAVGLDSLLVHETRASTTPRVARSNFAYERDIWRYKVASPTPWLKNEKRLTRILRYPLRSFAFAA